MPSFRTYAAVAMKKILLVAFCEALFVAAVLAAQTKDDPCTEGEPCTVSTGETGLCIYGVCVTKVVYAERRNLSFTIVVRYPEDKLVGKELHIRGNGLGLNWKVGRPLAKTSTDTWETTITYKGRFSGFLCESCDDPTVLFPNEKFEYRILINDTRDMFGANFALEISMSDTTLPESPRFEVYPWFTETSGSVSCVEIPSKFLGVSKNISLYLPPSFLENPYKKYGVLFVYDGRYHHIEFLRNQIFDRYIAAEGIMEETVIIGWGFNVEDRTNMLTPVPGVSFFCINGTFEDRCDGCYPEGLDGSGWLRAMMNRCGYPVTEGGTGDLGLDFLIKEALPKAAELAGGRLLSDRDHVGIMGYSLGGLMSCYAAWTRPEVFGYAACESSSLYWPLFANGTTGCHLLNVSMKDPELLKNRKPQRFYLDVGSKESGDVYHMDGFAIEVAERLVSTGFFHLNENVWYQFYPGHFHGIDYWYTRMWSPISVLLAPKGAPSRIAAVREKSEV